MSTGERTKTITASAIIACVTATATTFGIFAWARNHPQSFARITSPAEGEEAGLNELFYSSETAVVEAVKKANPAVVAITVSKNVPVYEQYYERIPGPFNNFFGDDFFDFSVPRVRERGVEKKEIGGGSGFLVSENGYIVTNRHVVADEEAEYTVFLNDGKKRKANIVARDQMLDLAVIKIEGTGFPYLSFSDSDKLAVGQTAIAIGNALAEFRNTVSVGVVSGLSRSIVASDRMGSTEVLDELIQTDAGINQGNSGGPLLDLSGDVIGVNVAVASGAENIGFAVSGNSAKSIVESVQRTGRIVRAYLGVRYVPITPEIAEEGGFSAEYGMLVARGRDESEPAVIPGSPADKAGIVEHDIILEIDGTKLTPETSLAAIIRNKHVGDTVDLKVLQNGEEKNIRVTLEEMKS